MATNRSDGHPDAGMLAVARVRGVREQDSRLGLRQAATDEREAGRRLDAVNHRLATVSSAPTPDDLAGFLAVRATATALAGEASAARDALAVAGTVTTSAREHWQRDATRLSAVELLLERRTEARRAERTRRERVETDDLVASRWLRARRTTGSAS